MAEHSLAEMLQRETLTGLRFVDVGCGSGLFSLAARRLGASVLSFDFDPQAVACAEELRQRYCLGDTGWQIVRGSVLDRDWLAGFGRFDIVYSWGVLHHTGNMTESLANVGRLVAPGGALFIAIYNDQGWVSCYWRAVKRTFNGGFAQRLAMIALHAPYLLGLRWVVRGLAGRLRLERGMSLWHDMLDWLGGYPFEVARPERILDLFRQDGFVLEKMRTCGGRHGCNEFVFRRG